MLSSLNGGNNVGTNSPTPRMNNTSKGGGGGERGRNTAHVAFKLDGQTPARNRLSTVNESEDEDGDLTPDRSKTHAEQVYAERDREQAEAEAEAEASRTNLNLATSDLLNNAAADLDLTQPVPVQPVASASGRASVKNQRSSLIDSEAEREDAHRGRESLEGRVVDIDDLALEGL